MHVCTFFIVALGIGCCACAQAQSIGAHTLLGQEEGNGANPALSAGVNTVSGSYLISFVASYASNTNAPSDNKGNVWPLLGAPVVYEGYGGAFDVKAYTARAAIGGSNHVLSVIKNGNASGELTLPFVEVRGAGVLQSVAQNYAPAGTVLTSGTVTTTGPALLLAFWWGDGGGLTHTAVPNNGFTILDSFLQLPPNSAVQCAVAVKQVSAAGSYSVSWATSPSQGAPLWLFAFQAPTDALFASGFE
jgi:hypothetical protein